ncbi:hypothetical protein BKA82DRAFT_785909 [Pisolithus tinctorius]|uniref:Uncharacterized protein n=1 Tax=Pisolithus tinctorius Marx 270 TaxID=870435 RepID=A0A0C3PCI6_PISTI|nr:hypothetical protein BKA82DRAFT_785909 [Pisolithus tinctorius]KIO11490.1 hypothetical protein M404DRAFT_785909 [Pisolithus tinctorius Marx 270]
MFIPQVSNALDRRTLYSGNAPLSGQSNSYGFSLDTGGMASFFGGDVAVTAMTTIHLDPTRRWLGWYNSPGTYEVARRYGRISDSRLLQGLFPGVPTDLATLLGLEGLKGTKYIAAHSGTILEETSPFSALLMKNCARHLDPIEIHCRKTQPIAITIIELEHSPSNQAVLRTSIYPPIAASAPILASIGTAVACGVFRDWFSFSMIVLGVLVNGISCIVIGAGEFILQYPIPHVDGPGDGILVSEKDKEIIVLKGNGSSVCCINSGSATLRFRWQRWIKWCAILLVFQLIVQILLIPQGTLFGQIMFIGSLTVSWGYNLWLSSKNKENIQGEVFVRGVLRCPRFWRYSLGTRTSAVVFTLLVLKPKDPRKILNMLLPNDTPVWLKFKDDILSRIRTNQELRFETSVWDALAPGPDKALTELLYGDAEAAYNGYLDHLARSDTKDTSL